MPLHFLAALFLSFAVAAPAAASGDHDDHGHDQHEESQAATGPHGGRLLSKDGFAVEVTIFETGVEPQIRAYAYEDDEALDPAGVKLKVTLHRLAREPEVLAFEKRGDFLLGDRTVSEPHSFGVEVEASAGRHSLRERYETVEARVTLAPEVAAAGGITGAVAGPRDLERLRRLTGRVGIASDRLVQLKPRFAGVVREAGGRIGDRVAAGAALAVVESSATLSRFRIDAPLDGVLLDRRAAVGSSVATDDVLFVVADLTEVWADFDVYGADTAVVKAGESVVIRDDSGAPPVAARISYVSPLRDVHTQTMLARAVLPNADGRWAPGAFLTGTIDLDEEPAAVAVPLSALQAWRGRDAVFIHAEGVWEARPVVVGRRGEEWLEILEGLEAGTAVATGNTFLLRAEVEKAGASHDH
ncbi:MAG: efflux RND transporter periplasmic adaptor subunit [Candidatus Binatia bacterium]